MARVFNSAKTSLQDYPVYGRDASREQVRSKDINEFIISSISSENGAVLETVTLNETNLPFQPIVTPVSQSITKYYYPGGQKDRVPTIQILGNMDNDVTLTGRFKATKIGNVDRRSEPITMSRILTRFVKEGNVCLFVLGTWIKYGILTNFTPTYKTDSDIDYSIVITVIGDNNPFGGTALNANDPNIAINKVFSNENVVDISDAIASITQSINEDRRELEGSFLPTAMTGTIPDIGSIINQATGIASRTIPNPDAPFTIKGYLEDLGNLQPIGEVLSIGRTVYNGYMSMLKATDRAIDLLEEFDNIVDKTSFQITKVVAGVTSQINRLRQVEENLFVSYLNVKNSTLSVFRRIGGFSSLYSLINTTNRTSLDLANVNLTIDNLQFSSLRETYVASSRDTYQSISTRFYGTWERWNDIKRLNGYGDELNGGEIIIIPS